MIETFDAYAGIFDSMKQPLTIESFSKQTRSLAGDNVKGEKHTLNVVEPIVPNSNPNITYPSMDGGYYETASLMWISRHDEFDKGTKVKTKNEEYEVTAKAGIICPGLFYYTIKR